MSCRSFSLDSNLLIHFVNTWTMVCDVYKSQRCFWFGDFSCPHRRMSDSSAHNDNESSVSPHLSVVHNTPGRKTEKWNWWALKQQTTRTSMFVHRQTVVLFPSRKRVLNDLHCRAASRCCDVTLLSERHGDVTTAAWSFRLSCCFMFSLMQLCSV